MSSSTFQLNKVQPTIFREYIGAKSYPDFRDFPDIINPRVKEFHFILAFATERYDETSKTGTFNLIPSLLPFTADIIKKLKKNRPNAKVVLSIGGRGVQYPFNTTEKGQWLDNAKELLQSIIRGFKDSCGGFLIDGIDVTYESIKSSDDFAECIGELIKSLREDGYVKVVSIAPSEYVRPQYKRLFHSYSQYIDWVDYQFYYQTLHNQDDFVRLYRELSKDYPNNILLAGVSTDSSDAGKISLEDFLAGCRRLLKDRFLPGIFVWDANDSAVQVKRFQVENDAQTLLVDFN